ncbi:MAG: EutP/PduV family microcompartment system protein [Eubacteriales bacterium]|nr:EutP/PduV family microcompartment system protein [Eubacteriales bacterium]
MRVMLIGPSAAGKTTLIQRLIDKEIKYDKTQTVEYVGNFIDTPGEYMQQRGYWGSLTITSHDADLIGLVQDSTSDDCWFSGGLTSKFEKPVVGILTKIDLPNCKIKQGRGYLELAGCQNIFEVSSVTNEGIDELVDGLHKILEKYKKDYEKRFADDYFD